MSYDDYTTHILQKYRLAVTIAVIKTKPENISLENHIERIRSNLNPEEMDFEDLNISINSDDFKFDETNLLLDNINENNHMILGNNNLATKINKNAQENANNDSQHVMNISQNELDDVPMYDSRDLNESITILDNSKPLNEEFSVSHTETDQRRSLNEVMDILKGMDDTMVNIDQTKIDQSKLVQEHDVSQMIDEDLTQCYGDIEITQCESIDINKQAFTKQDFHKNNEKIPKTNKQKIIQNDKPRINIGENSISQRTTKTTYQNTKVCDKTHLQDGKFKKKHENKPTTSSSSLKKYRNTKEYNNVYQNVANIFDSDNKKTNRDDINKRGIVSSEKPIMNDGLDVQHVNHSKNLPSSSNNVNYIDLSQEFTCNTHYSQSQTIELHMDAKYIHGIKRSLNNHTIKTEANISKKKKDDIIILKDDVIKSKAKQTDDITNIGHNTQSQIIANSSTVNCIGNNLKEAGIPIESHNYSQEDIFSQDLPDVFIPSQNTQRFDGNDGFCFNNKTQNQTLPIEVREKVDFKNEKGRIGNAKNTIPKFNDYTEKSDRNLANADTEIIENQTFVTESEVLTIPPLSVTNKNNNYEDSLGFPNCNKKAIYRNIDDKKSVQNRNVCPDFNDSQSQPTLNAKETEFGQTLKTTILAKEPTGCTEFDDNFQAMEEEQNAQPNDDYINFDDNLQDIEEDNSDTDTVRVPFKIIEELNKVKIYLNRRTERSQKENSGDTGYRSDISSKTSLKNSQTSISRVDQSAHSLYSYLTTCPMVSATQDIVREISFILGQLIDKLHGEEKYPAFLEELLDFVQTMLRLIYEDNSQLKTKDEYIHRIILLNRSVHIQRYTIEKITQNLENVYKQLTDKESEFEINNVDKLENMCHIFHLLEILLTKYSKNSANLSQNSESLTQNTQNFTQNSQCLSQNSQENVKSLKKSSIVDIWRKKWNANFKEVQNEDSQEKICEIEKCCAVLNKIIVDCFEGYSLVSYFALKCFNVLQK